MVTIENTRYMTLFILALVVSATGCQNMQALYNEQAYQQAVSLKIEALTLMDEATLLYAEHEEEVAELKKELSKAYEYARGRPDNEESTRQWELMKDPDRNLLGGFLLRWEQEGTLSPGFVGSAKELISDAFDTIIELESGKRKS